MRYAPTLALLCVTALTLGICPTVQAQSSPLKPGTWTGEIIPPDGFTLQVEYEVTATSDSLAIDLSVPTMGTFPFENIAIEADTLSFSWEMNVLLYCSLIRQANTNFEGECGDAQGITGVITMIPPQEEGSNE